VPAEVLQNSVLSATFLVGWSAIVSAAHSPILSQYEGSSKEKKVSTGSAVTPTFDKSDEIYNVPSGDTLATLTALHVISLKRGNRTMRIKWACVGIFASALFSVGVARADAFPIAIPGSEGAQVFVSGTDPIIATYQGNSAAYSNDLYLMLNAFGQPGDDGVLANDLFIFNNHTNAEGNTKNLGAFALGTELEFRLFVNNTGDNFFTGPAPRNPDQHAHARVQANWEPNTTLVSFEDLLNGPFDYNDLSFSFTNTSPIQQESVPEPATLGLLASGLATLVARRRRAGRA
jgi:hypothetical protein